MVWALGTAQLQLDAGGRQLGPPTLQPLQHRLHGPQAQGHAGGNAQLRIKTPQPMEWNSESFTPPVVQGQIEAAAGRR